MVCPYNRKSETQVQQWTQEYTEENTQPVSGTTMTKTTFTMEECQGKQCGAYHNGRCCYAAVSLENQ